MNNEREKAAAAQAGGDTASGRRYEVVQKLVDERRAALNLMEDAVAARQEAERAIAALQRSEARHAFLLMVSDAIRWPADPIEVQHVAAKILGEYLGASRVMYAEIGEDGDTAIVHEDYVDNAPSFAGVYRLSEIGHYITQDLLKGETLVVDDVATDERLEESSRSEIARNQAAACIAVPLVRADRLIALLIVHNSTPRKWDANEVSLIEEVAHRTWAATAQATAEAKTREAEDRYRTLLNSIDEGFCTIEMKFDEQGHGVDYRFLETSPSFVRHTGLDDVVGKWMREIAPDHDDIWFDTYGRIARTGIPERFEGSSTPLERSWSVYAFRVDDPSLYHVAVLFYDITERLQAERALRESEERLRLLTESFQDIAIITTDLEGTVVMWNPGAEQIFGYAEAEMVGRNARILFVPEDQAKGEADREMITARRVGRAADERWHLRKDGSRFYASGVMAPLHDGDALIGYAKIARDLTLQKRAEEELRRQHEELEAIVAGRTAELAEANEALRHQMNERRLIEEERVNLLQKVVTTQEDERRRIARDMHDSLGQQLTALRLKIASTKTELREDVRFAESLERLEELSKKIDSEVNFLVWELRPTVLDDLGLSAAIENYAREWSRHCGVRTDVHTGKFKSERLDTNIETNLYRILQEALNNTRKHSHASAVNIVLEARREARKKEIILVVEDDGRGFDIECAKPNFDSGRGLGLIGMRERAAIIGGKVEIESSPGSGTTVFVRVPTK